MLVANNVVWMITKQTHLFMRRKRLKISDFKFLSFCQSLKQFF